MDLNEFYEIWGAEEDEWEKRSLKELKEMEDDLEEVEGDVKDVKNAESTIQWIEKRIYEKYKHCTGWARPSESNMYADPEYDEYYPEEIWEE